MLVDSHQTQAPPTLHPIREEINIGNVKFITTDLGGHTEAREFWQNHYFSKNAIVFVLDAADRERFPEAKNELQKILAEPLIASLPVAIIANKIDKPTAASEQEIQNYFELIRLRTGRDARGSKMQAETRPLELFMCSIKEQKGHTDPFKWLSELLN